MEKVFKDVLWVQEEIKKKKAKVVLSPEITGTTKVTIDGQCFWNISAIPLLKNAYIAKFIVDFGDGHKQVFKAKDNKASITYTFSGSVGDRFVIKVIAEDNLGNQSDESSLEIELVENQPPTPPTIEGVPREIPQDSKFTIKIKGSTDPEGDNIFYKIFGAGLLFSKSTNISEDEEITVHTPVVTADTVYSITAVAVDDKGNTSIPVTETFLVQFNPLNAPVVNMDATTINEHTFVYGKVVLDDYTGTVITVTANKGQIKNINQTNGTFRYIAPDVEDKNGDTDEITIYYTKNGWTSPVTKVNMKIKYVPITGDDGIQVVNFKSDEQENDGFKYV